MFGISGEHLLVLLVILLIFGPKRLPDLGHSIGRTMKNFKDALSGQPEVNPNSQLEKKTEAKAEVKAEAVKEEKKDETPVS